MKMPREVRGDGESPLDQALSFHMSGSKCVTTLVYVSDTVKH